MKHDILILLMLATSFTFMGCELDDADRCLSKYNWNEEQAACLVPQDTEAPVDTSAVQQGLGESCWTDTDCTDYAPNICLLDPTDPTVEGMCTFENCTYDTCGGDFKCCDCTAVDFPDWTTPYCVDAWSANLVSAICDCR